MHSPLFRMRDCCCCIKDVFHAARQGVTSSRSRTSRADGTAWRSVWGHMTCTRHTPIRNSHRRKLDISARLTDVGGLGFWDAETSGTRV